MNAFWRWAPGGIIAMVVGLVLIIWPRKSGNLLHSMIQAIRPYQLPTPAVRMTFVVGWLILAIGALLTYIGIMQLL